MDRNLIKEVARFEGDVTKENPLDFQHRHFINHNSGGGYIAVT